MITNFIVINYHKMYLKHNFINFFLIFDFKYYLKIKLSINISHFFNNNSEQFSLYFQNLYF